MKTIKIMFLAVALTVTGMLPASNEPTKEIKPQTVAQEIGEMLQNPTFNVEDDLTAKLTIVINKDGEAVVLDVETEDEFLKDFFKSRLNYKKLKTAKAGGEFTIPVRIVAEK